MVTNQFDNYPHARNYANLMKRKGFTVSGPNQAPDGSWWVSATKKSVTKTMFSNRRRW